VSNHQPNRPNKYPNHRDSRSCPIRRWLSWTTLSASAGKSTSQFSCTPMLKNMYLLQDAVSLLETWTIPTVSISLLLMTIWSAASPSRTKVTWSLQVSLLPLHVLCRPKRRQLRCCNLGLSQQEGGIQVVRAWLCSFKTGILSRR